MSKATEMSAYGNNTLLQEETEVPSSTEDTASPDQETDQEPDPEVSFHLWHNRPFQTSLCHT